MSKKQIDFPEIPSGIRDSIFDRLKVLKDRYKIYDNLPKTGAFDFGNLELVIRSDEIVYGIFENNKKHISENLIAGGRISFDMEKYME